MKSRNTMPSRLIPLAIAAAFAAGVAVAGERVPITDPAVLMSMGIPPDATNVYALGGTGGAKDDLAKDFGRVGQYTTIAAKAFVGRENIGGSYQYSGGDHSCCDNLSLKGTEKYADTQLQLPHGALFHGLRFYAYDTNVASNLGFVMFRRCYDLSGAQTDYTVLLSPPNLSTSGSGGAQSQYYDLPTSITIDNHACVYTIRAAFDATTGLTLHMLRAFWERQISPAPASARFTDVPIAHQFFREIEALAGANITGGCTSTQYCSDQPVTRGQMAAFLARALGL